MNLCTDFCCHVSVVEPRSLTLLKCGVLLLCSVQCFRINNLFYDFVSMCLYVGCIIIIIILNTCNAH